MPTSTAFVGSHYGRCVEYQCELERGGSVGGFYETRDIYSCLD